MSRGLWFVAGAGAGVYALTRARRAAEAFTVEGLRMRLQALDFGARMFAEEVAVGRRESEPALRRRLGLVLPDGAGPDATPALTAAPPAGDAPRAEHEEGTD